MQLAGIDEPDEEVTQNACSLAAMDTFEDMEIYSNPMVRKGVAQMIGEKPRAGDVARRGWHRTTCTHDACSGPSIVERRQEQ